MIKFSTFTLIVSNFLSIVPSIILSSSSPQCIDDSGLPVDWYIVYKFPYLKLSNQPKLFDGYHYAYQTSKTQHDDGWHFSPHQITEDKSIFGRTLAPYFSSNRSRFTSMFYNDQPPTGHDAPFTYAHSKGLIIADSYRGFWFIHTVPKFVATYDKYSYVATGGRYGQVAMCISLSTADLTKIIRENFLISRPYVYSLHIDSISKYSKLGHALTDLEHHRWMHEKNYSELYLTSLGGQTFRSFYKSPSYKIDLYAGIVAHIIKTSLLTETWRHPPGDPLDSECSVEQAEVENIECIQLKFVDSDLRGEFSSYDDHSKWAISRDHQHDLVCIGDINRVRSQFNRGGGTTCITDASVWSNFNSFIKKIEKCSNKRIIEGGNSTTRTINSRGFWTSLMYKVFEYLKWKKANE